MRREQDVRAVCILCRLCHQLHTPHGGTVRMVASKEYETISNGNLLWMKQNFDPENYDEEYLQSVFVRLLPDPVPTGSSLLVFRKRVGGG